MTTEWFFSKSGQQQGPVSTEQLKQLAASGQLHPGDLVLKDGMGQWVEARKIKGLFPAQPMSSPQGPHNSPQPEATPPQWFFSNAGQQQGPVSAEQLKQLAGEGRLLPSDLVWKEGMAQWAEAKNIEGLFPPPPLPPAAIAGPPPMPAAAPAGPAVSSSPQMPAHAAVFQPQSLAEPFATVESQPFDFLDSSSTNTPYRSPRSFKNQPRKKKSLPLWLRIVMIVCASMILLYGGLRGWRESGGGSGVTNSRPTQATGGPTDQAVVPPGGGLERTPVNPGYGRELKVVLNPHPFNACLHSVRCVATEDSLLIEFDVDMVKWVPNCSRNLLVKLYDRNGNYLTHFTTEERFMTDSEIFEKFTKEYDATWHGHTPEHKFIYVLLKPKGNRFVYGVNIRDLRDASIIELDFDAE